MASAPSGQYLRVHAVADGYAIDLHTRLLGRLFCITTRPSIDEALSEAAADAERRGGVEVVSDDDGSRGAA